MASLLPRAVSLFLILLIFSLGGPALDRHLANPRSKAEEFFFWGVLYIFEFNGRNIKANGNIRFWQHIDAHFLCCRALLGVQESEGNFWLRTINRISRDLYR